VTGAGVQRESEFTRFNRARIEAFSRNAGGPEVQRVLLLGSSALKYATREEAELGDRLERATGTPVAALRITSNWGTFYDFEPLAADMLEARPDVVVLETEFLAADRPRLRRFLIWLRHWRSLLGLEVEADMPDVTEAEVQFTYPCWRRKASRGPAMLLQERARWVEVRPDGPGPDHARDFMKALLDEGIRVALVTVPRRPDFDANARATQEAAKRGPEWRALAHRVTVLEPGPLPAGLYCDLIHLTPAGRARYSDWLEAELARLLTGGP
jgi:hypothetical protein